MDYTPSALKPLPCASVCAEKVYFYGLGMVLMFVVGAIRTNGMHFRPCRAGDRLCGLQHCEG